jgi:hypothetical protein
VNTQGKPSSKADKTGLLKEEGQLELAPCPTSSKILAVSLRAQEKSLGN